MDWLIFGVVCAMPDGEGRRWLSVPPSPPRLPIPCSPSGSNSHTPAHSPLAQIIQSIHASIQARGGGAARGEAQGVQRGGGPRPPRRAQGRPPAPAQTRPVRHSLHALRCYFVIFCCAAFFYVPSCCHVSPPAVRGAWPFVFDSSNHHHPIPSPPPTQRHQGRRGDVDVPRQVADGLPGPLVVRAAAGGAGRGPGAPVLPPQEVRAPLHGPHQGRAGHRVPPQVRPPPPQVRRASLVSCGCGWVPWAATLTGSITISCASNHEILPLPSPHTHTLQRLPRRQGQDLGRAQRAAGQADLLWPLRRHPLPQLQRGRHAVRFRCGVACWPCLGI